MKQNNLQKIAYLSVVCIYLMYNSLQYSNNAYYTYGILNEKFKIKENRISF
jgi:hypothetical protein